MPLYLIERTFQEDFRIPGSGTSVEDRLRFQKNNAIEGVVWLYSLVLPGRKRSFCLYDAPTTEALRQAALRNGLPVDRITEVGLIEPKGANK